MVVFTGSRRAVAVGPPRRVAAVWAGQGRHLDRGQPVSQTSSTFFPRWVGCALTGSSSPGHHVDPGDVVTIGRVPGGCCGWQGLDAPR